MMLFVKMKKKIREKF